MTKPDEKQKILAVDDTPENLDVVKGILQSDYTLLLAVNGTLALKIAKAQKPDLILLDIMMPKIDGYEVLERLKQDDETKEIPVIFLTAKAEIEDEVKGFGLGCVDYITKPISPPILVARVKTHLALKRQNEILKENVKLREDVDCITRHDLKTPLNAIINYPKLINKDNLTEKQISQLDKIGAAGYKLLNMINLSLDLFKMEQGTYQFDPVPVNILSILDDIVQDNRMSILSKKANLEISINGNPVSEDSIFEIPGEKLLFYSMLANLIKNSLEASPRKETISIQLTDEDDFVISIQNKGTVPQDIHSNFFEKYATSGKSGGTGLGTYSAKLITETQGGLISMDSSEKKGTTIKIAFPKGN